MKRYFQITTLIFLFFNTFLFGQTLFIGGNIGLNLSNLNYKPDLISDGYDINFRKGITAGLFIEYPITSQFIISTELNYSMRGAEHISNGAFSPVGYRFIKKLDYLEIPITLQYRIPLEINIKPKIFAGAEASFLLKAKTEYYENDMLRNEVDTKSQFQSDEYAILLGIGADYSLYTSKIIIEVRYYYGINNINEIESSEIRNRTISFNFGYAFSIK